MKFKELIKRFKAQEPKVKCKGCGELICDDRDYCDECSLKLWSGLFKDLAKAKKRGVK